MAAGLAAAGCRRRRCSARSATPDVARAPADALVATLRKAGPAGSTEQTLQALGLIGGPHATAFLVDQAEHGTERGAREKALLALAQGTCRRATRRCSRRRCASPPTRRRRARCARRPSVLEKIGRPR